MKAILIKNAIVNGSAYFGGTEIEVDDHSAKRLIQRGLAVEAKETRPDLEKTERKENEE